MYVCMYVCMYVSVCVYINVIILLTKMFFSEVQILKRKNFCGRTQMFTIILLKLKRFHFTEAVWTFIYFLEAIFLNQAIPAGQLM